MMDPLEHLQMLKDGAAGVGRRKADLKRVRALRSTLPGFDRSVWGEMCGKGWLGLHTASEFCKVAEELGAGLAPEPLIEASMAARLLPRHKLNPVLAAERIILAAWQEQPKSIALAGETVLRNGRLNGRKLLVPMAAGADAFLVTLPDGLALVERDADGVSLDFRETEDGGHFGTLLFEDAPAEPIDGDATEALEHAIMAHSAYLLGLMDRAFAITRDYMKTRLNRRSGIHALQHRAEDMQVQLSLTRATIGTAVQALDSAPTLGQRQAAVSRAKLRASDAALVVTRTCLHLHGGLGYTDAFDIGLYVRKANVLSPLYGAPSAHRPRFRTIAPELPAEGDEQ